MNNLNFVGLAVGKYGEVSKELSILITAIANHGALVNWKKLNLRSEQVAAVAFPSTKVDGLAYSEVRCQAPFESYAVVKRNGKIIRREGACI